MINKRLAKDLGIPEHTQEKIEQLQDIRDEVREEIRTATDVSVVKSLVDSLVVINYTLQDLWGFPRNQKRHREDAY